MSIIPRTIALMLAVAVLTGCASRPVNDPIDEVRPNEGYRPHLLIKKRPNNDQDTLFVLSFSGGGTRAAAFAYGVLEELRRTEIVVDGEPRRMIDEVDAITGVSGGSFTALAYALYGERLFDEYEERFLKRNVQSALTWRAVNPLNWWKFIGGTAGRSELAAEYYDKILFEDATFADLLDKGTPAAIAIGTDISTGSRFTFAQNDFDLICSDLNKVRLSRAAATSSAVPVVLSAVTFNNYGGSCYYQYPAWVIEFSDPDYQGRQSGRAYQRFREMVDFQDSEERPYIHLVDGGLSDNIGVRGVLETLEELALSGDFRREVGFVGISRIVVIVVNSKSDPSTHWDRKENPPGWIRQLMQSTSVPMERYSFETVETMKDRDMIWDWRRRLLVAEARLAGATEEEAEASIPDVDLNTLDISFDKVADAEERARLMELPTSLSLPEESIDHLREVAGWLLSESPDYQAIVDAMSDD